MCHALCAFAKCVFCLFCLFLNINILNFTIFIFSSFIKYQHDHITSRHIGRSRRPILRVPTFPNGESVTTPEILSECKCSKIYDPICASDNKSYFNECEMKCANEDLTILYTGNCLPFK